MSRLRNLARTIVVVIAFPLGLMLFGGCTLINHPPVPAFTVSPTHGVAPLHIAVNATASSDPDGDALAFTWEFGDGGTAAGVTTAHTYRAAGKYTVTLRVVDSHGAAATTTATVEVSAPPADGGSPPPPPTI